MRKKKNSKRRIGTKTSKYIQRMAKRAGDVQVGSLRAQKMLNELSRAALEQIFVIAPCDLRGPWQQRNRKALKRARLPFETWPRTETSIGK